jgi:hypothetical protein
MNPYNLKQNMILYCVNGQTVTLTAFNDSTITVQYKGKSYERSVSVIGQTLFVEDPCMAEKNATDRSSASEPVKPISLKADPPRRPVSITPPTQQNPPRSCMNCKFQKSGECTSWDLCGDYQPAYTVSSLETDHWPQYGDATMFKRKGRKH